MIGREHADVQERGRLLIAVLAIGAGAVLLGIVFSGRMVFSTAILAFAPGLLLGLYVARLLPDRRTRREQIQLAHSRAIIELDRALSARTRLPDTLDIVASWVSRLVEAPCTVVELMSEDGSSLEVRAAHGAALQSGGRTLPDDQAVATAPMRYRDNVIGQLSCARTRAFADEDRALLAVLADQAAIAIENARMFEQVNILSLTDPLTGLANRRQLDRDLAREFAAARRGRRLVVVMFDLNNFKEYNDDYGHPAGDTALRMFADALHSETRAMNTAARYGGDEFIVLLTDAVPNGAEAFIEQIRLRFPGPGAKPPGDQLTFSAGFAGYDPTISSPYDLVAAADRSLYRSKAVATVSRSASP